MKINWFPGHMKKTLDELKNKIKLVDCVIYILDARAPESCLNPEIDEIAIKKPVLYVLSKSDLADAKSTKTVIEKMKNSGKNAVALNLSDKATKAILFDVMKMILSEKQKRNENKNISPVYKFMIIGVPNTGKSTLVNTLSPVKKAVTGDKAGVTKQLQWVRVSESFALLDTPGTLWPNLRDELVALKLAFLGSIKDEVLDMTELGFELVKFLVKNNLDLMKKRYPNVDFQADAISFYDDIARTRGAILRGGDIDYERLGRLVVNDFRTGKIGQITLDKV